MDTGDGTVRSTRFLGEIFSSEIIASVMFERNSGIASLLRAVMNQAVLTDIEVASTRPAAPVVGLRIRQVVLEVVHPGITPLTQVLHLDKALALQALERLTRS